MRTYYAAQGTLPSALRRPKWDGNSKKRAYVYTLIHSVNLIHFAIQQKVTQHCKATILL